MSKPAPLMPVAQALERILAAFSPLPPGTVSVAEAGGRVLAKDLTARVTQPPAAVSAMDGYAVRAGDVADAPVALQIIGQAPAGGAYGGIVGAGECVRIFTGGPVPRGADAIVIQEDTETDAEIITIKESAPEGHFIRPAGLDFKQGDVLLHAGTIMSARDIGLAGAMNVPWLMVRRRPRIAYAATGDGVVMPGDNLGPDQIISSNSIALVTSQALGSTRMSGA